MRVTRKQKRLALSFGFFESQVLARTLRALVRHYTLKPGELDPKIAQVWYSTRGCRSAGMSAADTAEWVNDLHAFKGAHQQLLESWCQQLAIPLKGGRRTFEISLDQRDTLLTVLNDYRLLLAARHDIGQVEMDARSLTELQALREDQQVALYEIHVLASVIEEILRSTEPDATSWAAP